VAGQGARYCALSGGGIVSQRDKLIENLTVGNIGLLTKPRPAFVQLGSRYVRPGDVVSFEPGAFSGWTRLRMADGNEWNVQVPPGEVANILAAAS